MDSGKVCDMVGKGRGVLAGFGFSNLVSSPAGLRAKTRYASSLLPRHLRSILHRVLSSRQNDPVILRRARRPGDQIASTAGPRRTARVRLVYAIVERAVERHQRHA